MAKSRNTTASRTPLLEWIMAAVGFALVSATIGFIAYDALTDRGAPPDIHARAGHVVPLGTRYLVTISAMNRGDRTAADVKIEAELKKGDLTVEKTEASFQYLPARSEREGGVYFMHDPRSLQLVLTPRAYQKP
jgi:uncharacterized protein (TIGR02588 family)